MAADRGAFTTTGPPPKKLPLLPPLGDRGKSIGLFGLLAVAQVFFALLAVNNSPLFGGEWGSFEIPFFTYIVLLGVAAILSTRIPVSPLSQPGTARQFFMNFGIALIATIVVLGLLLHRFGGTPTALSGGAQISSIVFYLVFVAPTEEAFFRVVGSELFGWPLSLLLFAVFHLGAYSVQNGGIGGLLGALFNALVLGGILLVIYDLRYPFGKRKGQRIGGYGASTAAHGGYDLLISGVIGGGLGVVNLGLHPF